MLLKKSTIAFCSSGSLSSTLCLPASITSSSTCPSTTPSPPTSTSTCIRPRQSRLNTWTQWQGSRSYATIHNDNHQADPSSPEPDLPDWPMTKDPTPYEIFHQSKTAPYDKKTFYQLAKLYHPDRHAHTSTRSSLSRATKLERYRLVVAANSILSDPSKRRAYDLYGAGWAGTSDMSNASWREADRAWRRESGSAAGNATWEDWERWHDGRQDGGGGGGSGKRQDPVYMSNGMFVAVLAVFVVAGSWGQATRAGRHSVHLVEMRETSSHSISEDMWRRRREKAELSREDRVESFLKQRDGWARDAANERHMPKD